MDQSIFSLKYSAGIIFPAFFFALLLAWFFYRAFKKEFPKPIYVLLVTLRTTVLFLLLFLLLEPSIKTIQNKTIKPILYLLVDDSKSMVLKDSTVSKKVKNVVRNLKNQYESSHDVKVKTLSGACNDLDCITFTAEESNLSTDFGLLSSITRERKVSAVLISDGIQNQGFDIKNAAYSFPVYTIGFGDTLMQSDVAILSLQANKEVSVGNVFFVEASVRAVNFRGKTLKSNFYRNDTLLQTQNLTLSSNNEVSQIRYRTEANTKGLHVYSVKIEPIAGEISVKNNSQKAIVQVKEYKKQLFLFAQAPHPDINFLVTSLEKGDIYKVNVIFPFAKQQLKNSKPDVVISFHPSEYDQEFTQLILPYLNDKTPQLFVLNSTLRIRNELKSKIPTVLESENGNDKVHAYINSSFSQTDLSLYTFEPILSASTLQVPFGNYANQSKNNVLLFQKIGSINTEKPLLFIQKNKAVLLGDGYWKWAIFEKMYASKDFINTEELMKKLTQVLISSSDSKIFKFHPTKEIFDSREVISFYAEAYNAIQEPVFGQEITLEVKNEENKAQQVSYTLVEGKKKYDFKTLPEGKYSYLAKLKISSEVEIEKGQFFVERKNMEEISLQANFTALKQLSEHNKAQFFIGENFDVNQLKLEDTNTIRSFEIVELILNFKFLLFCLLLLLSVEWFLRKYLTGKP